MQIGLLCIKKSVTMKYAKLIHATGAVVVIIFAIMKVLHIGQDYIDINALLTLAFLLAYIGQSWKVKLLETQVKKNQSNTIS